MKKINFYKLFNDKCGQYYPTPSYGNIHPVLVIGIVIFCIPFLIPITGSNVSEGVGSFIRGTGVLTILIGAGLSIFKASKPQQRF